VTGLGVDNRGSIPGNSRIFFFFSLLRPDQLQDQLNLLFNGYRRFFCRG